MSITNIMVKNCDNGAPSVSTVMVPGQSHISRGMTVLAWRPGHSMDLRTVPVYALVCMLDYSRGGFKIERLFWG